MTMKGNVLVLFLILALGTRSHGHGFMNEPRVRGAFYTQRKVRQLTTEQALGGAWDYCPHCRNGGGVGRLKAIQGNTNRMNGQNYFIPFEPDRGVFRQGVTICGDQGSPEATTGDHSATGKYRNPQDIPYAETYRAGETAYFQVDATTPHGGYLEFFLCNRESNGQSDVSSSTFLNGDCVKLERAVNEMCQKGTDPRCGPIDVNYPSRFYFPCRKSSALDQDQIIGADNEMGYKIPSDIAYTNGVIVMYWLTGNTCSSDGLEEYFTTGGWSSVIESQCEGDGGTRGGFRRDHTGTCTTQGGKFPEEFWNCADVKIIPQSGAGQKTTVEDTPVATVPPTYAMNTVPVLTTTTASAQTRRSSEPSTTMPQQSTYANTQPARETQPQPHGNKQPDSNGNYTSEYRIGNDGYRHRFNESRRGDSGYVTWWKHLPKA